MLTSTAPEKRLKILKEICESLNKDMFNYDLPPKENSIVSDINSTELKNTLKEIKTSDKFLETTEAKEMDEITRQIECITGYNLVTKEKTNIRKLKIDSPLLEHSNILEKQEAELKQAFINDIAEFYNLKPDQVNVRSIVRGSIELYFSLPEIYSRPDNIKQSNIPSFNNILQSNGIAKYTVSNENILPDVNKAVEIMDKYVRPVIIKSDETDSILMRKFGEYLPVLASLSSHVRIIHDKYKKTIEIHGPPDERAKVLHYFAELEDTLQGRSIENIEIISFPKELSDNYYDGLWNYLYNMARDFALKDVNHNNRLQRNTLKINPYLKNGCPAARSFINALERQGLNPNSYYNIIVNGVNGWHGTRSDKNIKSILENNLNISFRSGQNFGPGEYCATDSNYSINNLYWGDTNTLIVFFILKNNPFFLLNTHYVINNPSQEEMYMVPILIATFNDRIPVDLNNNNNAPPRIEYEWQWEEDIVGPEKFLKMGIGQPIETDLQITFEEKYQIFLKDSSKNEFTITIKRLNDKRTVPYKYNLKTMIQTNTETQWTRRLRRKQVNEMINNVSNNIEN